MKNIRSIFILFFTLLLTVFQVSCGGGGGGGGTTTPTTSSTPQEVISNFKNAAAAQDIQKMADNFDSSVKDAYAADFQKILNSGLLPKFTESFQTAQEVYVSDDLAYYEIKASHDGEVIIFHFYLKKDANGRWKIRSM